MEDHNWRLPAGLDELLPPEAWSLELIRRRVLDVFRAWGFEYIDPPVVEYLDALLVGAGQDMDLQTLKTVDQRSGRLLGVRSDMTAQAVRVDAHSLPVEGVQRLCYAGNVVLANPVSPLETRVPLKAGAELFGSTSLEADAEVIALMLEVLEATGIKDPILVIGHMGIYHTLVAGLGLEPAVEAELFTAVQSKAEADIERLLEGAPSCALLVRLPALMGEHGVLGEARTVLAAAGDGVLQAIDELEHLADLVVRRVPGARLRFDLAELVGYGYHNGPVFSAYHATHGRALARGGRYDGIGQEFGRARPATGFDVSLKELIGAPAMDPAIWVPWLVAARDAGANDEIRRLRGAGARVVVALEEAETPPANCDCQLAREGDDWALTPMARNAT